ncbi:MAG: ABC transporter permease [Bacteroidota bacterium]
MKKAADMLLRWFCKEDHYLDISGDLEELHWINENNYSRRRAEWHYLADVLLLLRLSLIKQINLAPQSFDMIFNYFKISARNLSHHKFFTFINVSGLAIGLAAFMLLNEYIRFEKSYDRFFSQSDQIYRLTTDQVRDGVIGVRDAMSFNPSGQVIAEQVPEIIGYTCTYKFGELVFRNSGMTQNERGVIAADSNYFQLFDYEVLQGNIETALDNPFSLVLSQSKAKEFFGNENPLGQRMEILSGFEQTFEVTAVIRDVPENTHYSFDMIMSIHTIKEALERDGWGGYNYYTYLLAQEGADLDAIQDKLPPLSDFLGEETDLVFHLQPLQSIHLYSDFTYEPQIHGSAESIRFLTIIAVFVLVMAWINYINLSTARAVDRAKEVGLRKVVGAHKQQLITQFLTEALLVNLMGALLALILAELSLPFFNSMMEKVIMEHVWQSPVFMFQLVIFFILGTLTTGFYPALVLSRFRPVAVLKGKFRHSKTGVALRKGLVVVQFTISLALIAGTLVVTKQVQHMRSIDKGFNAEQVVGFRNPRVQQDLRDALQTKLLSFYETLRQQEAIIAAASISNVPGGGSSDISSASGGVRIAGLTETVRTTIYLQDYDENAIATLDLQMLAGRNFDKDLAIDSSAVIINESMVDLLGFKDINQVVGQRLQFGTDPGNDKYPIIGVIKNYNRTTLKRPVEPTAFFYDPTNGNSVVKLKESRFDEGVEALEATWAQFFPDTPLDLAFLDKRFENLYKEDRRFGKAFGAFSLLALAVALLGLLGLTYFISAQRTKEVGVRKVLGASISEIIFMFFKDFLTVIGLAAIIGVPTIYFVMSSWLEGYAFRISFPWEILALSLLAISAFALGTVALQTHKVAKLNPAKTLKYE